MTTQPSQSAMSDLIAELRERRAAVALGGGEKRQEKQRAVRLLEERGAFNYRKSAETVAEALGVTRFTIYNYLNRIRA